MSECDSFPEDRAFLSDLRARGFSPRVVYDLGASTGVWSESVGTVLPEAQYHLFEPLAHVVEAYREDLHDRFSRLSNLALHPVALGAHTGQTDIYLTEDPYRSSVLGPDPIVKVDRTVRVPVFRLDQYAQERRLPPPELVKVDCQGAEIAILKGAENCLEHASLLILETWLTRLYGPETPLLIELMDWLRARGFALVGFGEQFFDAGHRLFSVDGYFMAENVLEGLWSAPPGQPGPE